MSLNLKALELWLDRARNERGILLEREGDTWRATTVHTVHAITYVTEGIDTGVDGASPTPERALAALESKVVSEAAEILGSK